MSTNVNGANDPYLFEGRSLEHLVAAAHVERTAKFAQVGATAFAALATGVKGLLKRLVVARKRSAAAAHLSALDDRMLQDIGLTRGEIGLAVSAAAQGIEPRLGGYSDTLPSNENRSRYVA